MSDTIVALASARGSAAGVAVIRVSGAKAFDSLCALTGRQNFPPRKAALCTLRGHVSRETLDQAIILPFNAPHSYTGEDVVEYHIHGGIAVIRNVLGALCAHKGHRMAEAGEFTRRAFENGRMDLTRAEAVADLIHAETSLQQAQALQQMGGALEHLYEAWRDKLMHILAYIEAEIEFPDEDLDINIQSKIAPQVIDILSEMRAHLDDSRRGERLRNGIRIAVVGAPNAGKSSLVNALAQRDIAIVSPIAGTTRDVIEVHLDIAGYPVILFDTAGLRPDQIGQDGQDAIESEGIRRALRVAEDADLRVILYDGTDARPDPHSFALEQRFPGAIPVINKDDCGANLIHPAQPLRISVKNNSGLSAFLETLKARIDDLMTAGGNAGEFPVVTRERHREAIRACCNALESALSAPLPELAAEDIRIAMRDLGRITGRVDVEDLLDVVFRDFCIGK